MTFALAKWIVSTPGSGGINTSGSTTALTVQSWTNMPYVIAAGVDFKAYVWKDGDIVQEMTFQA